MTPSGVGQQLGDYRLEAIIGQGGMGVVYRATQLGLERTVAVKVIAPALAADDVFRERFQREARMLAHVDHPHVIPIHHAGETDGQLFLSMRWVDGHDLAQEIRASAGGMDAERALLLLRQIGGALDAVHALGLVHRDIKPANVLIESRNGADHAYLTDFGAGRELDAPSEFTRTGQWLGTVDYIAPETLDGATSGTSSDLYGLACVLFEMLAAVPPFRRDTRMATQLAHQYDPPPSIHARRPDLPLSLDAVFQRALAKNADIRYGSASRLAEAFSDALTPAAAADTVAGDAPPAPAPTPGRGAMLRERAAALASGARPALGRARELPPRLLAIGGLVAVALVAGVVALAGGGAGTAGDKSAANVTRVVGVALLEKEDADAVDADEDRAYVLDTVNRKVIGVENRSLAPGERFALDGRPVSMLLEPGRGRIWVGLRSGDLIALGRNSGRIVSGPLRLPFTPDRLEPFEDRIVAMSRTPGRAVLVDPDGARLVGKPVDIGRTATGALGYGNVFLVIADARMHRFDRRLRRTDDFAVQGGSAGVLGLTSGPDQTLWVTDSKHGSVLRVDPATGKTRARAIKVGGHPQSVITDPRSAWVTINGTGDEPKDTVARIDLATGRVLSVSRVDYINGRMSTRGFRDGVYVVGSRPGTFDGIVLVEPTSSR